MQHFAFKADSDDARAIHQAISEYQSRCRWSDQQGGVLLPEGEGDLQGRILGEICRGYMEYISGFNHQR